MVKKNKLREIYLTLHPRYTALHGDGDKQSSTQIWVNCVVRLSDASKSTAFDASRLDSYLTYKHIKDIRFFNLFYIKLL